ncbi:MAG: heparinase II/III family protein [Bacteroidota bacterium]
MIRAKVLAFLILITVFGYDGLCQLITSSPVIPESHPRLFITSSTLPEIKAKAESPAFASEVRRVFYSNSPACLALRYLLDGNTLAGEKALNDSYNWLKDSKTYAKNRAPFKSIFQASIAFDYCYDLLGKPGVPSKQDFIKELIRVSSMGPGKNSIYPMPGNLQSIVGHFVEGVFYNQIFAGIAIYGDENTMYDAAAEFLFDRIQPENNFWMQSHKHHQGHYLGTRHAHTILAALAYKTLSGGKDLFNEGFEKVPYHLVYSLRPDRQLLREGDVRVDDGSYEYHDFVLRQTANYANDPYLRWVANQNIFVTYDAVLERDFFDLIYRSEDASSSNISSLPLTKYFPQPIGGEMIARTGWDLSGDRSNDAVVHMRIGEYYFGNHQHKDFGTFQIYYKGNLTGDSGQYEDRSNPTTEKHWRSYYRSTIAHNGLLIYDPNEKYAGGSWTNTEVDGGMRWPLNNDVQPDNLNELRNVKNGYQFAEVTAYEIGPDSNKPEYSFISGNLTKGYTYSNDANKAKVSNVTRSMVTFNTDDSRYPIVFMVFDRIVATNVNFKKTFLMHAMEKPSIDGKKSVLVKGNGKLVSYTLLPKQAELQTSYGYKINGKDYSPDGSTDKVNTRKQKAYEDLRWRLEVTPSQAQNEDFFMHAMAVMDRASNEPLAEEIIENELIGAKMLDKIGLFSKNGSLLSSADFKIEGNQEYGILVNDLHSGKWVVERDGKIIHELEASSLGKNIYFKSTPGRFRIYQSKGVAVKHTTK